MTLFAYFTIDENLKEKLEKRRVHIPTYNIFEDADAIQIEETSRVNDDLIPVLEYKITVNKESLHRHKQEWSDIFKTHYQKVLACPPNWDSILLDLYTRRGIEKKFKQYLEYPIYKMQQEALGEDADKD